MIYIKIDNDVFYDDAVVLVRSFYPRTEVMALKADSKPEEKDEILSIEVPDVTGLDKKNAHEVFKDSLYKKLSEKTGKKLPWGYLTGVRPSKIAYTMLEEGATKEQIKKHFMDKHYASEEKAELALTVARKELDILTDMDYKTGYSLYIGIPFCPSICLYCSFSSYALGAYKDYVDNYVDALIKEIRFVAESMKGRRLDTVYMGGGTPTTLSAEQLDKVLTKRNNYYDINLESLQLLNIIYKDSSPMLTFGTVFVDEELRNKIDYSSLKSIFPFVSNSDEPYKLEVPSLTNKEIQLLLKNFPFDYEGYTVDDYYGIELEEIQEFEKIYRYYPYYSEGGYIN